MDEAKYLYDDDYIVEEDSLDNDLKVDDPLDYCRLNSKAKAFLAYTSDGVRTMVYGSQGITSFSDSLNLTLVDEYGNTVKRDLADIGTYVSGIFPYGFSESVTVKSKTVKKLDSVTLSKGVYLCNYAIRYASGTSGFRTATVCESKDWDNLSTPFDNVDCAVYAGTSGIIVNGSKILSLTSTTTIGLYAYHNDPNDVSVPLKRQTYMMCVKLY